MKIRVVGLGNVFMSDEGFGPYAVRVLEAFYETPASVEIVDGGMPGVDLTPFADALVVVSALPQGGAPGEIRITRGTQGDCDVLQIGVVPEWVATGVTLSRTVRSAIAPVVGLVTTELERLGHPARLRATPRHPDTWWERVELEPALAV